METQAKATYDNQTLRLDLANDYNISNDLCGVHPGPGLFIGNGKVGAISTFEGIGAASSLLTCDSNPGSKYESNTIETFNPFKITFGPEFELNNLEQSLDLNAAVFNTHAQALKVIDDMLVDVSVDLYAPRNLPFCTIETVKLVPAYADLAMLPMFHFISCKKECVGEPEYNNNVVYDSLGNQPIYILTAQGKTMGTKQVVSASAYVFEGTCVNMGFNVPVDDPYTCFNYFKLTDLPMGQVTRFHVVSATMTSDDFGSPLEEVKKIVLNVISRTVSSIRAEHVKQWMRIWDSDVSIVPKPGISVDDGLAIDLYKRMLKTSLYNIYSSVRAGVNLDVNPSTFGFMDRTGSVLYSGDLSLIPLLVMLKPEFARVVLDYRNKTLGQASKLAAGYGYKGAKYPYEDDRLGYKNAMYWNTISNLTVFNTAAISINMWNYYRVVQDLDWLRGTGFPVLRANAEFFVSMMQQGDGHIEDVVSLSGIASKRDNTFTNGLVRLAIRYAVEASYELALTIPEIWIDVYQDVALPRADPDLLLFDGESLPKTMPEPHSTCSCISNITSLTSLPTVGEPIDISPPPLPPPRSPSTLPIPEPLFLFVPYFSEETVKHHQNVAFSGIDYLTMMKDNMDYYEVGADLANPLSNYVKNVLKGIYAQVDPASTSLVASSLDQYIMDNTQGLWGQFKDTTQAAMFVLQIAQGLAQLNVVGGVAETRFYYTELGLASLTSANMPSAWKSIKIGTGKRTMVTQNVLYYV